ncbi:MAG: hypothetical protein ACU83U_10280 [Gammaproteobacteria bacterium]
MADTYFVVTLRWVAYVDIELSRWPVLVNYVAKIVARPVVQQALKEEGFV